MPNNNKEDVNNNRSEEHATEGKEVPAGIAAALLSKEEKREKKRLQQEKFIEACAAQRRKVKKMSTAQKQKYYAANAKKSSAKKALLQGDLIFPVQRMQKRLRKTLHTRKINMEASIFFTSVIEYLTAELLELGGECAIQQKKKRIVPRHLLMCIQNDEEFSKLWSMDKLVFNGGGRGNAVAIHPCLRQNKINRKYFTNAVGQAGMSADLPHDK